MRTSLRAQSPVWILILLTYGHQILGQSWPSCAAGCISAAFPVACNSPGTECFCQNVNQELLASCACESCTPDQVKILDEMIIYYCGLTRPLRITCAQFWARDISSFSEDLSPTTGTILSTSRTAAVTGAFITMTSTGKGPVATTSISTPPVVDIRRGGLSTGAKAGIGIGIAIAVLFFSGLIAFLRKRVHISWTPSGAVTNPTCQQPDVDKMAFTTMTEAEKVHELHGAREVNPPAFHELSAQR